jgi:type I restriction enzyme R subunit
MDFRSKYLDIYDQTRGGGDAAASIINELDFELELIARDEINVAYILRLLQDLKDNTKPGKPDEFEKKKKEILDTLEAETQLRSKRALIEKFISSHMPRMTAQEDVTEAFDAYWNREKNLPCKRLARLRVWT